MEVRGVGQHHVTLGPLLQCGTHEFGQQDGQRVRDQHFTGLRANEGRDAVTEARRFVHPTGLAPTTHLPFAPFTVKHFVHPTTNGSTDRTERVAIEIDLALVQRELTAQRRQCVAGVHRGAGFASDHKIDLTSHKTGYRRWASVVSR